MGSNRRHLAIVLGVALAALGVDVVAAFLSESLALIADAAHRVTDVIGISIAFGAATIAARPATHYRSFGFARAEVIACPERQRHLYPGAARNGPSTRSVQVIGPRV